MSGLALVRRPGGSFSEFLGGCQKEHLKVRAGPGNTHRKQINSDVPSPYNHHPDHTQTMPALGEGAGSCCVLVSETPCGARVVQGAHGKQVSGLAPSCSACWEGCLERSLLRGHLAT